MKKVIFALAFVTISASAFCQDMKTKQDGAKQDGAPAKQEIKNPNGAQMKFETINLDYGTIAKGSEPKREFAFKNTGKEPLIISNAAGSCGCTVPTWPKEPILPGKKSTIKVSYDTQRVGAFTKTITLSTNAPGQESYVITIHGTVEADPTPAATPAPVKDMQVEHQSH